MATPAVGSPNAAMVADDTRFRTALTAMLKSGANLEAAFLTGCGYVASQAANALPARLQYGDLVRPAPRSKHSFRTKIQSVIVADNTTPAYMAAGVTVAADGRTITASGSAQF